MIVFWAKLQTVLYTFKYWNEEIIQYNTGHGCDTVMYKIRKLLSTVVKNCFCLGGQAARESTHTRSVTTIVSYERER